MRELVKVSPFARPIGVVLGGIVYLALMRGQSIVGTTPSEEADPLAVRR